MADPAPTAGLRDSAEIESWLLETVAALVQLDSDQMDPATPFFELGLDSNGAVELSTALSAWLERKVDATVVWNFPTIAALALHLATS
jgi:acyl carrier protein